MNILIVAWDFKPLGGGIAEYTHYLAEYLSNSGNSVLIYAPRLQGDSEFDSSCNYKVIRYDFKEHMHHSKIYRLKNEFKTFKSIFCEYNIDLVIGNSLCVNPYSYWLFAKIFKKPLAIFAHGRDIFEKIRGIDGLKRLLVLKNSDLVFCNTKCTQQRAITLGLRSERTFVAYPGIKAENFIIGNSKSESKVTKKFLLQDKKVIFSLGRLIERKGQDTMIKAMSIIAHQVPEVIYLIGGDGGHEKVLRKLTKEYCVEDKVIFTGIVQENERQAYYDACDIFAMINRKLDNGDAEAFGIVFLEANACGKPVIGGLSGGVPEAIVDQKTGILVDPEDIESVADKVIFLLKNKEVAKKMGILARERVEKEFDWGILVPKIEAQLERMIN
ncbi:MAG: glycosyltransferase family 4 protein [Candidatus Omnitrophota bacterium]